LPIALTTGSHPLTVPKITWAWLKQLGLALAKVRAVRSGSNPKSLRQRANCPFQWPFRHYAAQGNLRKGCPTHFSQTQIIHHCYGTGAGTTGNPVPQSGEKTGGGS